jgi:hypothetical protein
MTATRSDEDSPELLPGVTRGTIWTMRQRIAFPATLEE